MIAHSIVDEVAFNRAVGEWLKSKAGPVPKMEDFIRGAAATRDNAAITATRQTGHPVACEFLEPRPPAEPPTSIEGVRSDSAGAIRSREYRQRQKSGRLCVRVEISAETPDRLVRARLLAGNAARDRAAIGAAISNLVEGAICAGTSKKQCLSD